VTLGNLACGQAENQKKVEKAGGISLVVAAMAAQTKNVDMQEAGCMVLLNLGNSGTLLKYIKKKGIIGVLEAAVVAAGATAGCQKLGQKLLDKLAKVSLVEHFFSGQAGERRPSAFRRALVRGEWLVQTPVRGFKASWY